MAKSYQRDASWARLEGKITDPVNEGKSLAGMIDMITNKEIERGSKAPTSAASQRSMLTALFLAEPRELVP